VPVPDGKLRLILHDNGQVKSLSASHSGLSTSRLGRHSPPDPGSQETCRRRSTYSSQTRLLLGTEGKSALRQALLASEDGTPAAVGLTGCLVSATEAISAVGMCTNESHSLLTIAASTTHASQAYLLSPREQAQSNGKGMAISVLESQC
jgi:hypothetical protein